MSDTITITKKNVLEAAKVNTAVKEVLKKLCPEAFEEEFDKMKIYAFEQKTGSLFKGTIYKLGRIGDKYSFLNQNNSYGMNTPELEEPKELIRIAKLNGQDIKVFNNQDEYFIWAYNEVRLKD